MGHSSRGILSQRVLTLAGLLLAISLIVAVVRVRRVADSECKIPQRPPDGAWLTQRMVLSAIAFSPRGRVLACAGIADPIRLFEVGEGVAVLRKTLTGLDHAPRSIAFAPDGNLLAAACRSDTGFPVMVWDVDRGQVGWRLPGGNAVAFSPRQGLLAIAGEPEGVAIRDLGSGRVVWSTPGSEVWAVSVAFSQDGLGLLETSGRTVKVWDTTTHDLRAALQCKRRANVAIFSPDGKTIAAGEEGYGSAAVRIWDVSSASRGPRLVRVLRGPTGGVMGMAFSPQGKLLACGGPLWRPFTMVGAEKKAWYGGEVRVWEVSHWQPYWRWTSLTPDKGESEVVTAVAFSPDGNLLVAATRNRDKPLRYWVMEKRPLRQ